MLIEEIKKEFLYSRKNGTNSAKPCRPRTMEGYEWALGWFFGWLTENRKVTNYEDIRKMDILNFVEWLSNKPEWGSSTRLRVKRSLRTLFRWLDSEYDGRFSCWTKALGHIGQVPAKELIPSIKNIKKFRGGFSTQSKWGHRDYVAMSLMMGTGMRVGELCFLELSHLQLRDLRIIVPEEGKTGQRLVPVTADLVRLVDGWLRTRAKCRTAKESPYVFVSKYKGQCSPTMFAQSFKKNSDATGVKMTPHTNRHAFCTYYLSEGGNIAKLQAISGHKSLKSVANYLHLAQVAGKQIQEELEKVSPLKLLDGK